MASAVELATFLITECLSVAGGVAPDTCIGAYAVEYCQWSPAACWADEQTAWINLLQPLPSYTKCEDPTEQATALVAAKIACDVEALIKDWKEAL